MPETGFVLRKNNPSQRTYFRVRQLYYETISVGTETWLNHDKLPGKLRDQLLLFLSPLLLYVLLMYCFPCIILRFFVPHMSKGWDYNILTFVYSQRVLLITLYTIKFYLHGQKKKKKIEIRIQFCHMCLNLCGNYTIIIHLSLCHVNVPN